MIRKLSLFVCLMFVFSVVVASPAYAKKGRLVDSEEYKDEDFEKGCIEDYTDMTEGDGVEWVYVAPGVKLKDYGVEVSGWKNKSEVGAKSMLKAVEENWDEMASDRLGGSKGTLQGTGCVYWAERSSEGKRWIPYAGGHLAQAGVGLELTLTNSKGDIIAKIRHSGRQGSQIEEAVEEVVDDMVAFLEDH